MKTITLLLGLLLTTTPVAPAQAATNETEQAINQLRTGLVDSFNRGDIDGLISFLDTNVIVTWQNGEISRGPAEVKAYYQRMMAGDKPIVSKVTAAPRVEGRELHDNWCVSWGNLNDSFELTDGRKLDFNSRFTATLVKRGDRWLVSAYHASINAFQNPVLTLAVKKTAITTSALGAGLGIVLTLIVTKLLRRTKTPTA
jgi:ketosteroid isomerase-like protein